MLPLIGFNPARALTQTWRCPVADPVKRACQITARLDLASPNDLGVACKGAPVETLAHILIGARTVRELLNAIELRVAAHQGRAQAQWALHRVLGGLVTQRGLAGGGALRLLQGVQVLSGHDFGAHRVEGAPLPAQHLRREQARTLAVTSGVFPAASLGVGGPGATALMPYRWHGAPHPFWGEGSGHARVRFSRVLTAIDSSMTPATASSGCRGANQDRAPEVPRANRTSLLHTGQPMANHVRTTPVTLLASSVLAGGFPFLT